MRSRLYQYTSAIVVVILMSGCAQSTRHSNTMLFGTNTQFGIRAGTNATSVPEVNIGYSRQEAVFLPLVANVADDGAVQKPCDLSVPVEVDDGSKYAVHPCSLVAIKGGAQDSYSVLASFGAKFDGDAKADGTKAKGGLAQYFATGMAAQLLAFTGGASVVAIGDAAEKSAANGTPSEATVKALFGGESELTKGNAMRDAYFDFREKLLAKVTLTDPAQLKSKMTAFESAATVTSVGASDDCISVNACLASIKDNDPYRSIYKDKKASFDAAFAAWTIP